VATPITPPIPRWGGELFDPGEEGDEALKLIIGFERQPGMSRADCHSHLERDHAKLVLETKEFRQYLTGYVQNFSTDSLGPNGGLNFDADGVAELWFESVQKAGEAFSEPRYLETLRPDEMRFADLSRLICAGTEEELVWDEGDGGSRKVIRFLVAHPGTDLREAKAFWRLSYPQQIAPEYKARDFVHRYVQNWPSDEAQSIFPSILPLLCIDEFWLSDNASNLKQKEFEQNLTRRNSQLPDAVNIGDSLLFRGREKQVIVPPVAKKI
jgi:hypothetical protein